VEECTPTCNCSQQKAARCGGLVLLCGGNGAFFCFVCTVKVKNSDQLFLPNRRKQNLTVCHTQLAGGFSFARAPKERETT